MKKIISILLTASMIACSAALPFTAVAAETATTASQANKVSKKGTLTVTVYNEDEGGLYTDDRTSFMITGSPDQTMSYGMGGSTFLCSVNPSESNPFVLNDIDIISNTNYTIIDSGSPDYDGFNYRIDHDRSDKTFKFTENPEQNLSIYMKKNYFVVNSDTTVTAATHGQDIYDNMQAVFHEAIDLINSDDFKALDTADRISKAKALMRSLLDEELIADYAFDAENNVMNFTYKHGTITGQLRPAVFEDEHKQLDQNETTENKKEISYKIVKLPDKLEYKLGEQIDLKGIEIEVTMDKKEPVVYTYPDVAFDYQSNIPRAPRVILHSDFRSDKAGTYKVEVVGADNVCFDVKVVDDSAIKDLGVFEEGAMMTLDDVVEFSKKGNALTLNDFAKFKGVIAGSGIFILEYDLGKGYTLMVGSVALDKIDYARLRYSGSENYIDIRTDDVEEFIAEMNGKSDSTALKGTETLTIDIVKELSKKGSALDWKDFEEYKGRDVGSGLYIWEFTLEDGYVLDVGGTIDKKPLYILLSHDDDKGIDIRTDDVEKYLSDSAQVSNIKGDANCDGQVDLSDAVMIMQALANPNKYGLDGTAEHHLTEQGKLNGDMNGDGLTSGDALAIQRKLLGLDDEEKSFSATLLGIDKAKVTVVKVSSLPEGYDYSFTDENAQAVVDYLSNISLSTNLSVEDPGQLNGMTWVIRLVYENGDTVTLYDLGKFIHGEDHKWYEMTYEESQEFSNLIWKLGQTDNDKSIDNSAIAGKIFAYEKEGAGGYCTLSFSENGRFLYYPGKLSSYMDGGDWKVDGDTVSLIGMENKTIYLKITDDTLVYIAEGSDEFPYMDIKDGEKFNIYRPEISADKFQLNSRYSEYGLSDPKVELDLIVSELPEFCYVEDVRLYDEDDNFIGMMSPAMDADIWNYLVDCHVTEECSKTYYTLSKIRCGEKTYLDDVRSEITVNFKDTPAP